MDLGVGGSLEVTESLGEAGTAPSCASAVLALPQARLGVDTLPEPFLKTRTPPHPLPPALGCAQQKERRLAFS